MRTRERGNVRTWKLERCTGNAFVALLFVVAAGCGETTVECCVDPAPSVTRVPLTDMGTGVYKGFTGGLYPNSSNVPPAAHATEGMTRTKRIRPLDVNGNPAVNGKYVLLSIGMSNTTQEFCTAGSSTTCDAWTFMGKAAADPSVNKTTLALVNGAMGGQDAKTWDTADKSNYDLVKTRLASLGLSEKQVQVVWLKEAQAGPRDSLPSANSDAYSLVQEQGNIVRALKTRYPNLQQVFFSSRIYGGYATSTLNPEPYAYESGFAVKWTIQAQITEMTNGVVDSRAGSLSYSSAPWLAWGPYLWANGMTARSDGLTWSIDDFVTSDRTHPSETGRGKVADMLMTFFKTSQFTKCWFLAGQTC